MRTADGKIQRIRKDTHVMEAQVHSHPIYTKAPPPDHQGEIRPSMADPLWRTRYLTWRSELIQWIEHDAHRRGLDMLCVVEHLDEAHPHIHALLVPRRSPKNPRLDAKATHPGYAAQVRRRAQARERLSSAVPIKAVAAEPEPVERTRTRRRRGIDLGRRSPAPSKRGKAGQKAGEPATLEQLVNQVGTRAYKAAMRGWQSHLYETLNFRHGLARVGPGLERLSRRAWWQRQTQSEAVLEKKELATTLATVADNFAGHARVVDEQRRQAENEAARFKAEVEALKTELAAANDTIRRADELPHIIQTLEAEEEAGRLRLAAISADIAEADHKLRRAQDAEAVRKKSEAAAAQAERRRERAEAAVVSLEQREEFVRSERIKINDEKVALKIRERDVKAKLRGMAAWANGRLDLDANDRLIIIEPRAGRNPDDELASLQPVERWLIDAVKSLNSLFYDRLDRTLDKVKRVIRSTIRAWSEGLIYRTTSYEHGVGLRKDKALDAAVKFQEETFDHKEIVYSTLPLLPDLTSVHDVMKQAEIMRGTLDTAERRRLNAVAAKLHELGGRGPGRS
ncbi:hypothetical protein [Novosphingobium sp. M1R2S20]|uniref:Plasmid recombination enzyme n=1 Tax=Novosphingobium rhizovicinum TaxID=3228928 RepID=A0ABV3R7R2_9SPHN